MTAYHVDMKENTPCGNPRKEQENRSCPRGEECIEGNGRVYVASPENHNVWCYLSLFPEEATSLARRIKKLVGNKTGELYFRMDESHKDIYVPNIFVAEEDKIIVKRRGKASRKHTAVKTAPQKDLWGLIFLQGAPDDVIVFLKNFFPNYFVMKDCAHKDERTLKDRVAVIRDEKMQILIKAVNANYTQIRFLKATLAEVAKGQPLRQMVSGALKGERGYIVRIQADRHFVFSLNEDTLACISGVHNDLSVIYEDYLKQKSQKQPQLAPDAALKQSAQTSNHSS